jgi:hypothetical protein
MTIRAGFGSLIMVLLLTLPAYAAGNGQVQKYFNDVATQVKATDNPVEKRAILNESIHTLSNALGVVQRLPSTSNEDFVGIERFKTTLQEKQDELAGSKGYVRVGDGQLNAFSDYVVQDMEQADPVITISLVTLLLIILVVVLIMKV